MDDVDRKLLNLILEDFPVTVAPFAESSGLTAS
jgi:DNA-binding Lrp family transcriptional regulator